MALWYKPSSQNPATRANGAPHDPGAITGGPQRLDELAGIVAAGPEAAAVVAVMGNSKLLSRKPKLAMGPETDTSADAYGRNATLWCFDMASEKFGCWMLNVTGDAEVKDAEAHGSRVAWGWYIHAYGEIPSAAQFYELSGKAGGWSEDAMKMLRDYQPKIYDEVRVMQGFPSSNTGTETPVNKPSLPPGLGDGGAVSEDTDRSKEFSVISGGFWVAVTPQQSAANKPGNPHKGASVINPGDWKRYAGDMTPDEAFAPLDEFKEAGWSGLDQQIIAYQGGNSAAPAVEEVGSAINAAMNGDRTALRALKAIGIEPPGEGKYEKAGSWLDRFGQLFG